MIGCGVITRLTMQIPKIIQTVQSPFYIRLPILNLRNQARQLNILTYVTHPSDEIIPAEKHIQKLRSTNTSRICQRPNISTHPERSESHSDSRNRSNKPSNLLTYFP
ncbi:hypothetical protein SAMN04488527_13223 [Aliiroseovarius crassostreae]|nr:hypothetical protein SAMN04488527_13223 [Aliiroseovarius crassostreae]